MSSTPDGAAPFTPNRIEALDGVRGAGTLAVLATHSFGFGGGWFAVQSFFVLSGFLITRLLLDQVHQPLGRYLTGFLRRRAGRILPGYFAWLLIVTLLFLWLHQPPEFLKDFPYLATFTVNFTRMRHGWTFHPLTTHLWTISVELQFYLLWPFVVRWLGARRLMFFALLLVVLAAASRLLFGWWLDDGTREAWEVGDAIYWFTFGQIDSFALGGFVAAALTLRPGTPRFAQALAPLSLLVVASGALVLWKPALGGLESVDWSTFGYPLPLRTAGFQHVWGYAVVNLASAALVGMLVGPPTRAWAWLRWALSRAWLRELGRVSYAMYLVHWGVALLIWQFGAIPIWGFPAYVFVVYAIAATSDRWLEQPILAALGKRGPGASRPNETLSRWVLLTAVLGGVTLLSLVGGKAETTDDAFILLVYVRHLLQSGHFFWNIADGSLDGFTSLLDLLVKAALGLISKDLVLAGFVGTVSFAVLSALLGAGLARSLAATASPRVRLAFSLAGGLLVASSPQLSSAAAYLLETPLFVAVVLTCCVALIDGRGVLLSMGLLALILVRPEGVPIAAGFAGAWVFEHRDRRPLLVTLVGLGLYVAFRVSVFGTLAPNTFYAKSSESRWLEVVDGWRYLTAFTPTPAGVVLWTTLVLGWWPLRARWSSPERRRLHGFFWLMTLGSTLLTIGGGGDCYPGARFLVVPLVLAFVTWGCAASGLVQARPVRLALGGLVLLQLAPLVIDAGARLDRLRDWPLKAAAFDCDADFVHAVTEAFPGATVAQSDFQAFKYFADGTHVQDLHGLNDRELAHVPFEGPVLHGKYSPRRAARTEADVWIWGYLFSQRRPISEFELGAVLSDPALAREFSGYPEFPDEATRARMISGFTTASVTSCGKNWNFLVRRELQPRGDRVKINQVDERPRPEGLCIDVGTPEARKHLRSGFSGDERDGDRTFVWSEGPRSSIDLGRLPAEKDFDLVMTVSSLPFTDGAKDLGVDIAIGETILATRRITPALGDVIVPLPRGVLASGPRTIEFRYERTARPGTDPRELALQFDRICLAPRTINAGRAASPP